MRKIFELLLFTVGAFAQASTFVGNGGSVGDVELQVTVKQVQESLTKLRQSPDSYPELCKCTYDFRGRAICQPLESLNEAQFSYCQKTIGSHAAEVLGLLEGPSKLRFTWAGDSLSVLESNGQREVDAVSNIESRMITLKQERFLKMTSQERIFLLTHELFHFIAIDGSLRSDADPVGPFLEANGGRKMLNALGAAVTMLAYQSGSFGRHKDALDRSQASRDFWLDGGLTTTDSESDKTFSVEKWQGGQIGGRYYLTKWNMRNFGLVADYARRTGKKSVLGTAQVEEQVQIFSAGVSFRLIPWQDPLTFFGQSHFVFNLEYSILRGNYKLTEDPVGEEVDTASSGWTLSCKYFIPFQSNFWAFAGVSYSTVHHDYPLTVSQISVNYDKNTVSPTLGVSYGF